MQRGREVGYRIEGVTKQRKSYILIHICTTGNSRAAYSLPIHRHVELRNERPRKVRERREREGEERERERERQNEGSGYSAEAEFLVDGVLATVCRAGNARSEQPRSAEEIFRSRRPRRIK